MGTAIRHPVPGRVKPSFVIFDIRALWHSRLSVRVAVADVKNYKRRLNPAWHWMLYSCTHMATVGIKGLSYVRRLMTVARCQRMLQWNCSDFNSLNLRAKSSVALNGHQISDVWLQAWLVVRSQQVDLCLWYLTKFCDIRHCMPHRETWLRVALRLMF